MCTRYEQGDVHEDVGRHTPHLARLLGPARPRRPVTDTRGFDVRMSAVRRSGPEPWGDEVHTPSPISPADPPHTVHCPHAPLVQTFKHSPNQLAYLLPELEGHGGEAVQVSLAVGRHAHQAGGHLGRPVAGTAAHVITHHSSKESWGRQVSVPGYSNFRNTPHLTHKACMCVRDQRKEASALLPRSYARATLSPPAAGAPDGRKSIIDPHYLMDQPTYSLTCHGRCGSPRGSRRAPLSMTHNLSLGMNGL